MINRLKKKINTVFWTIAYKSIYQWLRLRCLIGKQSSQKQHQQKHILILAWWFPPTISGGVYRPLSFARYATARGWKVSVLCFNDPVQPTDAGKYLLAQLPSEVDVIRINKNNLPLSYNHFPRVDGGFANVVDSINLIINTNIHPTVLLASGPPFHNFIVGYHLSKYFGCPLVLDYRDEWTLCPFEFVSTTHVDKEWEAKCLGRAKAVIFTTNSQKSAAEKKFIEATHEKLFLLPNGIELDDLVALRDSDNNYKKNNDIAFFGFLGSHTPPDSFIKNIEVVFNRRPELKHHFKINFIGGRSDEISVRLASSPVKDNIQLTDQVSKRTAIEMMGACAGLLLLNPKPLDRYIPGKLFDYLASGAPILVYGDGGEAAQIVDTLKAGLVIPEGSPEHLECALDKLIKWQPQTSPSEIKDWIKNHTREKIANQLVDLLEKI